MADKKEYQYFEVCIGDGPGESETDTWVCIKGVKTPTIQDAERFLHTDVTRFGGHVLSVTPIDRGTAEDSYDFDEEALWPVFGE